MRKGAKADMWENNYLARCGQATSYDFVPFFLINEDLSDNLLLGHP